MDQLLNLLKLLIHSWRFSVHITVSCSLCCCMSSYYWEMPHTCILFGACRIRLCVVIYKTLGVSMFLLLLFEPFSIAFETLQVMSWELCPWNIIMFSVKFWKACWQCWLACHNIFVGYFGAWISVTWYMDPSFSMEQFKLREVQIIWYISSW